MSPLKAIAGSCKNLNLEEELLPTLFQFKPGIELSWFPGRELVCSQFRNALPTGLKKRLRSPCGSRHFKFRLFTLRPSLTSYHPSCLLDSAVSPCYFYCFRCLSAFRRGRTLGLSRISVCNGPSAITRATSVYTEASLRSTLGWQMACHS